MFKAKNLAHILTILESIEKIVIYTADFHDHEAFFWSNDQLNYNATFNLLLVIGEETKKLEPNLKVAFPKVPWSEIAGLRNHLDDNYRGADPQILFDIIRTHLPELKTSMIKMLSLIEINEGVLEKSLATNYYKNIRYLLKNI